MTKKIRFKLFSLILLPMVSIFQLAYGAVLGSWDNLDAYKPNPVLFLHGFGPSNTDSWNFIKSELNKYFDEYSDTLSFLESVNFNDPNGSIDTYSDGRDGWADKVNSKVNELLNIYKFKGKLLPINFVCFSMGGLAVREFATNYSKYGNSYKNINKIITIGTPHAGTSIANIKKIEDAVTGEHKYVWEVPYGERWYRIATGSSDDTTLQLIKGELKLDPDGEAARDMAIKSEFLRSLNARTQPSGFKNYSIYGKAQSIVSLLLNNIFFALYYPNEPFTCGDGVVPRDSQIGVDVMSRYPDTSPRKIWNFDLVKEIPADHFGELAYKDVPNDLLSFLDSTAPQFELTSHSPNSTTVITDTYSIHIQGKVYKEYLPADSQLITNIVKTDDNSTVPIQLSLLSPSSFWIPNNPDSPVAEFDPQVSFPGNGTYQISCQIKNPANQLSDTKTFFVQVNVPQVSYIIVHCHNPEGKEINSIQGVRISVYGALIYDGNSFLGLGASNSQNHNQPILVSKGAHRIKAVFNGITKEETISLNPNETKTLVFTFERTDFDINSLFSINKSIEINSPGPAYFHDPIFGPDYYSLYAEAAVPSGYSSTIARVDTGGDRHPPVYPVPASLTGSFSVSGNINSYSASAHLNAQWDIAMDTLIYYDVEIGPVALGNIPISVPVQTNFYNWFVQLKEIPTQRGFAYVYLGTKYYMWEAGIMPFTRDLKEENNYYFISVFDSQKNYTQLSIGSLYSIFKYEWRYPVQPVPLNSNTWSFSYDFPSITMLEEGSVYKMSSVPYDLTGTGI